MKDYVLGVTRLGETEPKSYINKWVRFKARLVALKLDLSRWQGSGIPR